MSLVVRLPRLTAFQKETLQSAAEKLGIPGRGTKWCHPQRPIPCTARSLTLMHPAQHSLTPQQHPGVRPQEVDSYSLTSPKKQDTAGELELGSGDSRAFI